MALLDPSRPQPQRRRPPRPPPRCHRPTVEVAKKKSTVFFVLDRFELFWIVLNHFESFLNRFGLFLDRFGLFLRRFGPFSDRNLEPSLARIYDVAEHLNMIEQQKNNRFVFGTKAVAMPIIGVAPVAIPRAKLRGIATRAVVRDGTRLATTTSSKLLKYSI